MPKPVAVAGDTKFETSTEKLKADSNQTGSWQLVTSQVVAGQRLAVAGKSVEILASAAWIYAGGTSGTPPVPLPPIPDQALLKGTSTVLKDLGQPLLRDGDEASGAVDRNNLIKVAASQRELVSD